MLNAAFSLSTILRASLESTHSLISFVDSPSGVIRTRIIVTSPHSRGKGDPLSSFPFPL